MTRDEIQSLRVGSVVLYGKRRTPRPVLAISRSRHTGLKWYFTFAILRCSWTTRAITVRIASDLYRSEWQWTPLRVRVAATEFDRRLLYDAAHLPLQGFIKCS